ncbi:MAG: hypothetical protein KJ799_03920 [Bacteroidetes bacterium]|nr:hypothetical protein [Bacteroidota bacterium]
MEREILYAPDYVVNAGGLINVANELEGYRQNRAMKQAEKIYEIVKNVISVSKKEKIPTLFASSKIAEDRLAQISNIRNIYSGNSTFSGRLGELIRR